MAENLAAPNPRDSWNFREWLKIWQRRIPEIAGISGDSLKFGSAESQ
jgi:hypothetical protein